MKLGVQGYTLRTFMQNEYDFEESLRRIRQIGYTTLQLSAMGNIAPATVQELCLQHGIQVVLTHSPEQRILHDTDTLIAEHLAYGCKYIGIGSMSDKYRDPEWIDQFAKDFTLPAKKMQDAGLKLMYHNHHFEFARLPDQSTLMQRLLDQMPSSLMGITADIYWLQFAGIDVCKWLDEHSERLHCVHLKDLEIVGFEQRMAPVYEGNINFDDILKLLTQKGVTEYALVEQDTCYESPFVCLEKSYRNCMKTGYFKEN